MSPANSRSSFISSWSKKPTVSACSTSTPIASSPATSGSTASERVSPSTRPFPVMRLSAWVSLETIGSRFRTAWPITPIPPGASSRRVMRMVLKNPSLVPSPATGRTCIAPRSTSPIQAIGKPPGSRAILHASRYSSSRLVARTINPLMPLITA